MEEDLAADIEIDPNLFIKCRLCIEEDGSFPIHQPLQDQIKFCFDITVQDFDYLSKLLCKKCRTILGEFVTIKKKFIANQTLLLDKLQSKEKQRELNDTKAECSIDEVNKEKVECSIKHFFKENPYKAGIYQIREAQESKTRKNAKKRVKGRNSLFNSCSRDDEKSQSVSASYSRYSTKRRKRKFSHSTESSSDKESVEQEKVTVKVDECNKALTWDQSYQKFYACRFCDYHNHTEEGIIMHGKIHSKFLESYREPLKKHCIIQMEKMDERPNVTGNPGNVVLSHDKIVSDVHNTCYYVKYLLPKQSYESKNKIILYDSSKDDAVRKYNRKNKNIILKSRSSSNKLVVLEGSKIETSDENCNTKVTLKKTSESPIPCIDILDTSSNDSTVQLKDIHLSKDNDLRIINNVATDCFKTYLASCAKVKKQKQQKKHLNKNFDEILHRTLLSVGKKLMPTNVPRGLPTPGLLKYLQYKNVTINWIPTYRHEQNHTIFIETAAQKNYTNLKGWSAIKGNVDFENRDKIPHDNLYNQLPEKKNYSGKIGENNEKETHSYEQEIRNDVETSTASMNTTSEISSTSVVPVAKKIMDPAVSHQIIVENNEKEMHIYEQENNNDVETNKASINTTSENSSTSVVPLAKTYMGSAVSHLVMDTDIEQGNKLLNANPVANPKQLPKKSTFMPFYEVKKLVDSNNTPKTIEHVKDTILKHLLVSEGSALVRHNHLLELPMPIITSTTSLAETNKTKSMKQSCIEVINKPEAESDQRNERANNIPRIKCKPVSELMPQSPRPVQEVASVNLMPHLQTIISKMTPITAHQLLFTQTDRQKITVNSVHLPNSSSISPIEYFKILLKMHGLELISQVNYELTQDYVSLVKFKAQFSSRIIMWLSLFAYKSTFCLKLRNSAEEMDLDQLPANWQMKILEAYRGEVSQKILQFSKTLNERLHNNAKQFVLLLGSIEFKINPG